MRLTRDEDHQIGKVVQLRGFKSWKIRIESDKGLGLGLKPRVVGAYWGLVVELAEDQLQESFGSEDEVLWCTSRGGAEARQNRGSRVPIVDVVVACGSAKHDGAYWYGLKLFRGCMWG